MTETIPIAEASRGDGHRSCGEVDLLKVNTCAFNHSYHIRIQISGMKDTQSFMSSGQSSVGFYTKL